ncbi:Bug family tripartite tricarboxylate transporter substrate binding protein [Neoroseomonas lacus]|uniref:Exported protein n=1 Tax=Neoroseomonas lacus TaxID=287609 RepID=A0A917L3W6_9PROT|nr:tripartite tricarboxylate transporter substrate binding protein [Neoroseomonas lacus]GGJ43155.1 exported protein [Neoroseomonas lacus]
MTSVPDNLTSGLARRRSLLASGALATGSAFLMPKATRAQTGFPSRPLRLVHAFAPGSGTDNTGRAIADRLSALLGQPVVVENRPGANMIIGTEYAARQPADGHTLIMVTLDNLGINPNVYRNPGYAVGDFDPLTLIGFLPLVLIGPAGSRFSSFEHMRRELSTARESAFFGTWGVGSVAHMYGELLRMETGVNLQFVPFAGAAPATTALLGGQIDFTLSSAFTSASQIRQGSVKAFAIGGDARHPELPDVPTFAELGFPKVSAVQWHGIAVRAGGNRAIIDRLYAALHQMLDEPETRTRLLRSGYSGIDGRTPDAFAGFIAEETRTWADVVRASGVTATR